MKNRVEPNKKCFEISSGVKNFISVIEITSGILGALAIFVFLFSICTNNYSYHTSMEICYYSMLFSFVCLPVYLLICCGIFYFMQEDLYFLIPKNQTELISGLKNEYKNAEEVKLKTIDDITLHGFL